MRGSTTWTITKFACSALFTAICAFAALPAVAADCDGWTMDGYRLGMTVEQASDVRAMKEKRSVFSTKEKGEFKGFLEFDDDGRLIEWIVLHKNADHDELKASITARLGEPVVNEEHRGSSHIGPKFWTAWETDWVNPECHTIVRLRREHTKVYTAGDVLQVDRDQVYCALVDPDSVPEVDWDLLK